MTKQETAWEMLDCPKSIRRASNDNVVWYGTLALNDKHVFLYLYGNGQGFYGELSTPFNVDIGFKTKYCGFDIEIAKIEIVKQFKNYCNTIYTVCAELMQELDTLESEK